LQESLAGEVLRVRMSIGADRLRLASLGQRMGPERMAVVAGSKRPDFPTAEEAFLLRAAVSQAVIAVYGAAMLAREQAARVEADLRAAQRALGAEVGAAIAGGHELGPMLERCTEAMVRLLGASFAGAWTVDSSADGGVLGLRAYSRAGVESEDRRPLAEGAFEIHDRDLARRPNVIEDLRFDPPGDLLWAKEEGMVALAGHPLLVDGRVVGLIRIASSAF